MLLATINIEINKSRYRQEGKQIFYPLHPIVCASKMESVYHIFINDQPQPHEFIQFYMIISNKKGYLNMRFVPETSNVLPRNTSTDVNEIYGNHVSR